jgi:hypothetical protein
MSEFNSSSSLDDELLEDDDPPPPPPPPPAFFAPAAAEVVEVPDVEVDEEPLDAELDEFAELPLPAFDDAAFDDAVPVAPLVFVEVCALVPAFEAVALPVTLP